MRDVVVLRAILSLLDKGIPLQRIRRNLETVRDRLPDLDDPAAALRLLGERGEKSDRLVLRHDGRLEEAGGQLLLEFEDDARAAAGGAPIVERLTANRRLIAGAVLAGATQATYMAFSSVLIQQVVPDELRGRVSSIGTMTLGLFPLGSLAAGGLAELFVAPSATLLEALFNAGYT
ncbi:MAG: hypothetical protein IIC12_02205 [Proteobacteria bacterium]|nr:hypothetical protein [Pseudomonadota bacterium]